MADITAKLADVLSNLLGEQHGDYKDRFNEQFRSILETKLRTLPFSSYSHGIHPAQMIDSISETLESLSGDICQYDSGLAYAMWNPFVAAIIAALKSHLHRDITHVASLFQQFARIKPPRSTEQKKPKLPKGVTPLSTSFVASTPDQELQLQAVVQKVTKALVTSKKKKTAKTSTDPTREASPREPVASSSVQDANTTPSTEVPYASIKSQIEAGNKHPFHNQHSCGVKCKNNLCTFCITASLSIPVTQCSAIRRHAAGHKCHPSGWYPHITPQLWSQWRHIHNTGVFANCTTNVVIAGSQPSINSVSPTIREVTYAADGTKKFPLSIPSNTSYVFKRPYEASYSNDSDASDDAEPPPHKAIKPVEKTSWADLVEED